MKFTELTRAEDQVMQVIWSLNECCLGDIVEAMPQPRPAYTTISTVVRTLVAKGFVTHKTYGKTNVYSPAIDKKEYSTNLTTNIAQRFFDNSPAQMLSSFVDNPKLTAAQKEELKNLARQLINQQ